METKKKKEVNEVVFFITQSHATANKFISSSHVYQRVYVYLSVSNGDRS